MSGDALAVAAEQLVGTRFRLHGRDPGTGLDCVGVLAASLAAIGHAAPLPRGYALRSRYVSGLEHIARDCQLSLVDDDAVHPGDVLLARTGPCQFHLLVAARGGGFVHAHAGRRRVVLMPGPIAWPVAGHWRLAGPN